MDERVANTVMEMLTQRGYEVEVTQDHMIGRKTRQIVIVFYCEALKVNNDRIQDFIAKMKMSNITHAIVIYQDSVTPTAQKVVDELQGMRIELFPTKTLRFNITKHRLVPKHILLSKSEMASFKQEFGTKIPVLRYSDPVARFLDFQRGDVIKIERANGFICYRIVK